MGVYGALLELPSTFSKTWSQELTIPEASTDLSGDVRVRRGRCVITIYEATFKGTNMLAVQYKTIWSSSRDENERLLKDVVERLITLGARKLDLTGDSSDR